MSTTPTHPKSTGATFHAVPAGGTLAVTPQPDEPCYPLPCDEFLTLRDGEMSEPRSVRDACVGAFLGGVIGLVSMMATLDWDAALKQGRHPIRWTTVLWVLTLATLGIAFVAHLFVRRTRTRSAYSRLVAKLQKVFNI